jgi:hypothetical protein
MMRGEGAAARIYAWEMSLLWKQGYFRILFQGFALPFIAMGTIIVVPPQPGSFLQNGY